MNYALNAPAEASKKPLKKGSFKGLWFYMKSDKYKIALATLALIINSAANLAGPFFLGYAVDHYIANGDFEGTLRMGGVLLGLYLVSFVAAYVQTILMGTVAQQLLFTLRNAIFNKLQELPLAFFNQNKAGDLISRINNDTDKLNQFFSQSLMQFIGSFFTLVGTAIFLLTLDTELGAVTLAPALVLLVLTQLMSAWIRKKNASSLQATGGMSAEIQESLDNFKAIVAFNRRDYFRSKFKAANDANFKSAVQAGYANTVFTPIYGLSSQVAQLLVLAYGIHLISQGSLTVGLLISYLSYASRFYDPLRHMAALWAFYQAAMAAWDRITVILNMKNNMPLLEDDKKHTPKGVLQFKDVSFSYPNGQEVLHKINFELERGKTYALVGPTGGGKTTTASLMARLYDPSKGEVLFSGQDIRAVHPAIRTKKIGFILQDAFLFTGTVRDNIVYANEELQALKKDELDDLIKKMHLTPLLKRFEDGLDTKVENSGATLSLGQRQLIAFVRAVLRQPDLLILDEATANIDTVTEQLLEDTLKHLSKETTLVIIAHRLNTIENADEIFFVNSGEVLRAGSMEHAVDLLLHGKRNS